MAEKKTKTPDQNEKRQTLVEKPPVLKDLLGRRVKVAIPALGVTPWKPAQLNHLDLTTNAVTLRVKDQGTLVVPLEALFVKV